jgi:DNA-directed RNA polymerase subunit M/transcription elongation factor TFIIS
MSGFKKITAPKIEKKNNENVKRMLKSFFLSQVKDKKVLKSEQTKHDTLAEELSQIKKPDGNFLLSLSDPTLIYEICGIYVKNGSSPLVDIVQKIANDNTSKAFFSSDFFENERKIYETNISILNSKVISKKGIFKCPKCSSTSTETIQIQTRSSDEPMRNFNTCNNCNNRWSSE